MRVWLIFFSCLFIISCSVLRSSKNGSEVDQVLLAWENKISSNEISKILGQLAIEKRIDGKVRKEYYFEKSIIPKLIFFYNQEMKLEGIFYFVDEIKKKELLEKVSCNWTKDIKMLQKKDMINSYETNRCAAKGIEIYSSKKMSSLFEVWFAVRPDF